MKNVTRPPFNVINEDQSLLVARYLIEDNYFDEIELNLDLSCETELIALIFKKMIGKYKLIDKKSEERIYNELSLVSIKF